MTAPQRGVSVGDCQTADGTLDIEQTIQAEGVDHEQSTYDDSDHCEATATDRAAVGVTNDSGEVLLVVDENREYALLPSEIVEPDDSVLGVARDTVEGVLDTTISTERVRRIRQIDHRPNGTHQQRTTHVVVSATPTESPVEPATPGDNRTAGWHDELPAHVDAVNDSLADIRLFLPEEEEDSGIDRPEDADTGGCVAVLDRPAVEFDSHRGPSPY